MKTLFTSMFLGTALLVGAIVATNDTTAQVIDLRSNSGSTSTPADVVAAPVEDGTEVHHQRTLAEVKKAIESSDDLRPFVKRRLLRRLERPRVALAVTDYVTANAIEHGIINVPPPPMWSVDPDVQGQFDGGEVMKVDWDGLLSFIERLIPLIIQLIGLFGG